jgi:hypothetical protein
VSTASPEAGALVVVVPDAARLGSPLFPEVR